MTITIGSPALAVSGVAKSFGATQALRGVSFVVRGGTVHGLLGENGSGKSTLVKILSGYHVPDAGALEIWGSSVALPIRAGGYHELGIGFVHQSLGLADALSVAENLRVSKVARASKFRIRWRQERALARVIMSRHGLDVDPAQPVARLTRSEKTMLTIVRALNELESREGAVSPGLLVLDEPTGAFTIPEKEWLYSGIRAFTQRGGAVMFISHDIDEILEITDQITVLRDGSVAATVATRTVTGTALAELIVGRPVSRTREEKGLGAASGRSAPVLGGPHSRIQLALSPRALVLSRIDSIAGRLEPTSNIERFAYLFDWHPDIPGIDPYDHTAHEAKLLELRTSAVHETLEDASTDWSSPASVDRV